MEEEQPMSCVRMCGNLPRRGATPPTEVNQETVVQGKRGGIHPSNKEPIGLPEAMPSIKVSAGIWKRGCVFHLPTRLDWKIILVRPRFIFLMSRRPIVILRGFKSSL